MKCICHYVFWLDASLTVSSNNVGDRFTVTHQEVAASPEILETRWVWRCVCLSESVCVKPLQLPESLEDITSRAVCSLPD